MLEAYDRHQVISKVQPGRTAAIHIACQGPSTWNVLYLDLKETKISYFSRQLEKLCPLRFTV